MGWKQDCEVVQIVVPLLLHEQIQEGELSIRGQTTALAETYIQCLPPVGRGKWNHQQRKQRARHWPVCAQSPKAMRALTKNCFVFKNTESSHYISRVLRIRNARKGKEKESKSSLYLKISLMLNKLSIVSCNI